MRPSFIHDRRQTNWLNFTVHLASLTLVVAVLYWARDVLIPIALAVLLTFILSPIVTFLRRRGLGRTPSAIVTVAIAFGLVLAIGTLIVVEFQSLANELPAYRQNILKKTLEFRTASKGGAIEKFQNTVQEVLDEIERENTNATRTGAVPVVITGEKRPSQVNSPVLSGFVELGGTAAFVVVLAVFMLLRREDLRDRLLRVAGSGRLVIATKAIDETGRQVSKYLLRQSALNAGYGLCVGIGLFFIGVPYAVLWGFLAAVLRFVPYVGPWIGAIAPILMSLAVHEGWTSPLLVVALIICLELVYNLALEPVLYGQSIGVSEVALLVMIGFWTWLWGPIGMVLAAPMTVCLMVISKGVPDLEFIRLLLSSKPALNPQKVLYQRLIAKDVEEAMEVAVQYASRHSRADLFENLLIPALASGRMDREKRGITQEDYETVVRSLDDIVRNTAPPEAGGSGAERGDVTDPRLKARHRRTERKRLVCGCPGYDAADEVGLKMLAELLPRDTWEIRVLPPEKLVSENIKEVLSSQDDVVCIGLLPGAPLFAVRQFCKRLRAHSPHPHIVAGVWGEQSENHDTIERQLSGLVHATGFNLAETKNHVVELGRIERPEESTGGTVATPNVFTPKKSRRRTVEKHYRNAPLAQGEPAPVPPS